MTIFAVLAWYSFPRKAFLMNKSTELCLWVLKNQVELELELSSVCQVVSTTSLNSFKAAAWQQSESWKYQHIFVVCKLTATPYY